MSAEIPKNEEMLPKKAKTTTKMDKLRKIVGTPKRKKTEEELVDHRISIKNRLLQAGHDFEDDEINLTDEKEFERFMERRNRYDEIQKHLFKFECKTRESVIYDDSEFVEDIMEIVNTVPNPIIIYATDLEPLNQKLTEFINKPGGYLADYIMPEFDDVRRMLKEIREKEDCQVYENFIPKEGTEQFDDYITKIIADVKEKIAIERPKQFIKNWEEEFRNGLKRKGKIEEKNEKYEEIDKKLETLESSTSTAFAQELRNLKEEGKLGQGDEPTGEDVDDLENDDLSEMTSISEENESSIITNSNHHGEVAAKKEGEDLIELGDSDLENDEDEEETFIEPMETNEVVKIETKGGKSNNATNKSSQQNNADGHFMDLDNPAGPIIGNGESASSPPITPAKFNQLGGPIEKCIEDEEDDDDVICID